MCPFDPPENIRKPLLKEICNNLEFSCLNKELCFINTIFHRSNFVVGIHKPTLKVLRVFV